MAKWPQADRGNRAQG